MLGNRSKHIILGIIFNNGIKNVVDSGFIVKQLRFYHWKKPILKAFRNLLASNYISENGGSYLITQKGIDAYASELFIKEDLKITFVFLRDLTLVLANSAIVLITYKALNIDNSKNSKDIERLQKSISNNQLKITELQKEYKALSQSVRKEMLKSDQKRKPISK